MNFDGETIRLTPLDSRLHLIDRGPLVLDDMKTALATEPDSLQRVSEQHAIEVADGHPEEWLEFEVELTELGETAPASQTISDLVVAVTRTSHAAIEVWGPVTSGKTWPYIVVPWVDFETMGASAAARGSRVSFGGSLFKEVWGWHGDPPTESNGLQVPFAPLLDVPAGALWATGFTDVPPPAATPRSEWDGIIERSEWKGYIPGRSPAASP
ncbi:hypothetical protein [Streptomyces sp. S.PB5]|uniref:hypothetical protein n=1 Tax=Streptomyces sp. S.PB5 TaxID=3020844 RepID=UPI0025B16AF8|nr:hypothetical protein [Streptomyces sp. S.PB5]MDN3023943.1 hypothetical protein [Streptomyces sp. S.PB5]